MSSKRRILLGVLSVFLLFFIIVCSLVSSAIITNYNNLGQLTRVITLINKYAYIKVDTNSMVTGAINGIVESLGDPYSTYMPATMFNNLQEEVQGSFGGVGLEIDKNMEHLYVTKPLKNTPASKAGIEPGDIILNIDNKDTKNMSLNTAVSLIRGPVGSKVSLVIYRKSDNKIYDLLLTRQTVKRTTVESEVLAGTKIAYIGIEKFTTNTANELESTFRELGIVTNQPVSKSKIKGIILNLRGNPGGELESAVKVANFFIPEGPIVYIQYKSGYEEIYRADKEYLKLPLVVLVDGNSASASEIVAGAIKDTKTGTLVGTKTFGKGVVQSLFSLPNNAGLKLTTGKYLTPLKKDINKKGITPDIIIENDNENKVDLQLEKAINLLK